MEHIQLTEILERLSACENEPEREDIIALTRLARMVAAPALMKYQRKEAPARLEYELKESPAWAAYYGRKEISWEEYQRVEKQAQAEYSEVEAPAWAEYVRELCEMSLDDWLALSEAAIQKLTWIKTNEPDAPLSVTEAQGYISEIEDVTVTRSLYDDEED